ncbi:MAG: hypothetical protein QOF53_3349 [Nocardioidaceae bacterium]|jgi:hypothetical protein|nr:hypothetical protein [Nocardioidaceae bacterium]
MPRTEEQSSKSAKILYRPIGIVSSLVAGVIAGSVFKQVWKHATPGDNEDAPKALESEYGLRQILIASAVQGAIFATVKAVVNRGGARLFQKATGEWPGD